MGVFPAMLTCIGIIIGGGIVGLPFALLESGLFLGLLLNLLNVFIGTYSCHLLLKAKNITGFT